MIKIAIIDDHKVIIDGLKLLIEQEKDMKVVAVGYNAAQAIEILKTTSVDLLLLDVNLPDKDGITVCKEVTKKFPKTKVLALTTYDKGAFVQQMLKAGASGYLHKSAAADELIVAIRKVSTDEIYLSSKIEKVLMNSLRNQANYKADFIPQLTRRELQVLKLIAAEYTTKEIANTLFLSENTIETHRRNLLSKLNVRNVAGMIKIALKRGLID